MRHSARLGLIVDLELAVSAVKLMATTKNELVADRGLEFAVSVYTRVAQVLPQLPLKRSDYRDVEEMLTKLRDLLLAADWRQEGYIETSGAVEPFS